MTGRQGGKLRISRKDISTGAISLQPRSLKRSSKTREARVVVTFGSANTPMPVRHALGFVPSGYSIIRKFRATGAPPVFAVPGDVYNTEPLSADKNVIVLYCTQAGTTAEILVR